MTISSRTPEGAPNRCPVCGNEIRIEPTIPPGDAPCPACGSFLWFAQAALGDDADFLVRDAIVPDLRTIHKADCIREIVARLSEVGAIGCEHEEEIVRSILKREELGSTGIGEGLAVPHAKHEAVKRLIVTVGFSRGGIEFESLDGRPVHTIFLLLSPIDRPKDHLRALERISRYLHHDR